jgi:hypothetical protein
VFIFGYNFCPVIVTTELFMVEPVGVVIIYYASLRSSSCQEVLGYGIHVPLDRWPSDLA